MRDFGRFALSLFDGLPIEYGEVRVVERRRENISVKNGVVEEASLTADLGFGIRVMTGGAFGFASSFEFSKQEAERIIGLALGIARSSTKSGLARTMLYNRPAPVKAGYSSHHVKDPFSVPVSDKIGLLLEAEKEIHVSPEVKIGEAFIKSFSRRQLFLNTAGSEIEQHIISCGGGLEATAVGENDMQRRSYPNSWGDYSAAGYEFIEGLKLKEAAAETGEDAVRLLKAPDCPSGLFNLVVASNQLALQIHESVGHPLELDRILGMEASYAGTSFVETPMLGSFEYGSQAVNIYADAAVEGGLGSFGYDDEGTPAQRFDLIKEGVLTDVLSSCETAPDIGRESNGTARAESWNRIPLVRMTNINLKPGAKTLGELFSEAGDGLYLETNRSWSIDDKRINFQFGVEKATEIKGGKPGRIFKNATYTGITPEFWRSCSGIAAPEEWRLWGLLNCGKGEPSQVMAVGHGASPALFKDVKVGVGR